MTTNFQYHQNKLKNKLSKKHLQLVPENRNRKLTKRSSLRRKNRKRRQNSDIDQDIDRLLNRDSEINVPIPVPAWEKKTHSFIFSEPPHPPPPPPGKQFSEELPINDILVDQARTIECTNEAVAQDLGISCLKKGLNENPDSMNNQPSRHFSVKPMMVETNKQENNKFKTPAETGSFYLFY